MTIKGQVFTFDKHLALCLFPPLISGVMANPSHSWATRWETQTGCCRKQAAQTCACQTSNTAVIFVSVTYCPFDCDLESIRAAERG